MNSSFGYIDIILLGMLAAFIILRLRNILGRKTGHQEKPISKYFPKGLKVLKESHLDLQSHKVKILTLFVPNVQCQPFFSAELQEICGGWSCPGTG